MTDDPRPSASSLKGRLADVFVPALVEGKLESLGKRLGNRATVEDPVHGRASSLASLEPMMKSLGGWFKERNATYRHVYSTTGVDRDAAEGILAMTIGGQQRELPIAVVAERRRLREIELRVYYTPDDAHAQKRKTRGPLASANPHAVLPQQVLAVIDAMRDATIDSVLGSFEVESRVVDPSGTWHHKRDNAMTSFLGGLGAMTIAVAGSADDGRTCCVEATITMGSKKDVPALLSFERGNSGLFTELRLYWD